MTPEQLDEIEKLAEAWIRYEHFSDAPAVAKKALPLVKSVREARQMEAVSKAFHDVAVKERDYERVRANRIEKERDEARAEVERLREVVRKVHFEMGELICDYRALEPILDAMREIHKITKGMVE